MSPSQKIPMLQRRRDDIRGWLDDEAPYTAVDQKHLEADSPERAYWHHGYQAALTDVIDLLNGAASQQKAGSEDISS